MLAAPRGGVGTPLRSQGDAGGTRQPRAPADDLDATFEELVAADTEIVQEPTDQPWGTRDCAVRDPSGNMIRIDQPPA